MGIELMNVKGNITLGGEISGQVELDNTITEEIKEVLNECKHIEIIEAPEGENYASLDLWELEAGIYYLSNPKGVGFRMDLAHGTPGGQTSVVGDGSLLILGGAATVAYIEEHPYDSISGYGRSYVVIGTASNVIQRFEYGTLRWHSAIGYSGETSILEQNKNKKQVIDASNEKSGAYYPSIPAVVKYVKAAIDAIEIPEATGGITEITETTLAYDLPTGVYKINSNGDYCLYPDDSMWPNLINGVAIISNNLEIDGEYTWILIGMDDAWTEAYWQGVSYLDPDSGEYIAKYVGVPENDGNRRNDLNIPANVSNVYYPSTQAVVDYINSKLVPIELDVGGEHADNEYYNANTVDQVLMEVVVLVEGMTEMLEGHEERISALESK